MGLINVAQKQPAVQPVAQPPQSAANPGQSGSSGKHQKLAKMLEAAQKLMYNAKTRPLFMKLISMEGDKLDIASTAAVKVVLTLVDETKGQIDPTLVAPAGVAIVGDVLDFMEKTNGTPVTEAETHQAVQMFLEKLQAAIKGGGDSMISMPAGV